MYENFSEEVLVPFMWNTILVITVPVDVLAPNQHTGDFTVILVSTKFL